MVIPAKIKSIRYRDYSLGVDTNNPHDFLAWQRLSWDKTTTVYNNEGDFFIDVAWRWDKSA